MWLVFDDENRLITTIPVETAKGSTILSDLQAGWFRVEKVEYLEDLIRIAKEYEEDEN